MIIPSCCPICNSVFKTCEEVVYVRRSTIPTLTTPERHTQFICYGIEKEKIENTGMKHYYTHRSNNVSPEIINQQSFTLEYKNKIVLVTINFTLSMTNISVNGNKGINLNKIITPDFPELKLTKSKIATYLMFQ